MVRLAGLADLHVEETSVQPYRDLFAEISQCADVLALCGDLTNLGKVREGRSSLKIFAHRRTPGFRRAGAGIAVGEGHADV
jgi:Icc-related predicted phosphoesterase